MRLIDADAEVKRLEEIVERNGGGEGIVTFNIKDITTILNGAPIAYDVDKVVEKLEEAKETHEDECGFDDFEFLDCDIAIDIVKKGGLIK